MGTDSIEADVARVLKASAVTVDTTEMRPFTGAWAGAVLAIALSIAYDTSSNVSVLEGGSHAHLQFKAILAFAAVGAFVGFFAGAIGWAAPAVAPVAAVTSAAHVRAQRARMMVPLRDPLL